MFKKLLALALSATMLMGMGTTAFATESTFDNVDPNLQDATITEFIGDDGLVYEYIQYADPVSYDYDGSNSTLLGKVRLKNINSGISARDYREWYEYSIIDNGIVDDWVYMSNPYFVKSIARGETHEASIEKSVSISPKASIDIPSGSQSSVNKALAGEFSHCFGYEPAVRSYSEDERI